MTESIEFNSKLKLNSLLIDIRNYYETKEIISALYYNKFSYLLQYEKYEDKYWLVSDIILFAKKNNLSSYKKKYKTYNNLIRYTNTIYNQFPLFWGFLTPNERNHFIQIRSYK